MMGLPVLLCLVAIALAVPQPTVESTCGVQSEVKLIRSSLGSSQVDSRNVFYLPTPGKTLDDDEDYMLLLSMDNMLYSSMDGGHSFELQNPLMPNGNAVLPPMEKAGVREVTWSHDGSVLYGTSHGWGFWRKQLTNSWEWINSTDFPLQFVTHPSDNNLILVSFVSPACFNQSLGICQRPLRFSRDRGTTFTEVSKQSIQFYWSTQSATFFYSEHYDPNANFNQQDWYHSKLYSIALSSSNTLGTPKMLLDHESGSLYRNGTLMAAVRVSETSGAVWLYSSTDDGAHLNRNIFREFADDEIEGATAYNIVDFSGGSIFINVRRDKEDRGDLYMSGAYDHDFTRVLSDNVRSGPYGDLARIGSIRGVYLANVWAGVTVPEGNEPDENPVEEEPTPPPGDDDKKRQPQGSRPFDPLQIPVRQLSFSEQGARSNSNPQKRQQQPESQLTAITYDNGGEWDFVPVPSDLQSQCPPAPAWCGLHFLGRSAGWLGQAPYSPKGAVGIALASGNVGSHLDQTPGSLNTFLTRDAGVTWTKIAEGDNLYQVCDRGGVLAWIPAYASTPSLSWSWDEGISHAPCAFPASMGSMTVNAMLTSPSRDGLRIHLLSSKDAEHFITTVDFSSLAALKCAPSDYEMWVPKDPDGAQGCLLGSLSTYRRRKQNVQCFNVDNDAMVNSTNCRCEADDYECDDCYRREAWWNPKSPCVPDDRNICNALPNPCANGVLQYHATRGYRKVPFDTCVSDSSDSWQPDIENCVNGNTQSTSTQSTTTPSTTSTQSTSSGSTSSSSAPPWGSSTTPHTTSTAQTTASSSTTGTATTAPGTPPSNFGLIVGVVIFILVIAALSGTFFVLRRNPRFQAWANGRFPTWLVPSPEDTFSTLGELDAPPAGLDDEDF